MIKLKNINLNWNSDIIPSKSICGLPLHTTLLDLKIILSRYCINIEKKTYQFENSPILILERTTYDDEEIFTFEIYNQQLTNWNDYFHTPDHAGVEKRAFSILIRKNKVFAITIWDFELREGNKAGKNIYQGKLPQNIGLGSFVRELLPYTDLEYDGDELFFTDSKYGGLEITGYCCSLDDIPNQIIKCLSVIPEPIVTNPNLETITYSYKDNFKINFDFSQKKGTIVFDNFEFSDNEFFLNQSKKLKEDLMQVEFPNEYILDIGWFPAFNIEGNFQIKLIKNYQWGKPIFLATAKNLSQLKYEIKCALAIM